MSWWFARTGEGSIIGHFPSEAEAQKWANRWNSTCETDTAYAEEDKGGAL